MIRTQQLDTIENHLDETRRHWGIMDGLAAWTTIKGENGTKEGLKESRNSKEGDKNVCRTFKNTRN